MIIVNSLCYFKCTIIVCKNQFQEAEGHGPVGYMDVFTRTHAVEHVNPDGTITYTWHDDKSSKSHVSIFHFMQY